MKALTIIVVLAVVLFVFPGCAPRNDDTSRSDSAKTAKDQTNMLRVGMGFVEAETTLKAHNAKACAFQIVPSESLRDKGMDLHFYGLQSGVVIELVSEPGKEGRKVNGISVSTYTPKSWESKTDPEYLKFFDSFKSVQELNLE